MYRNCPMSPHGARNAICFGSRWFRFGDRDGGGTLDHASSSKSTLHGLRGEYLVSNYIA